MPSGRDDYGTVNSIFVKDDRRGKNTALVSSDLLESGSNVNDYKTIDDDDTSEQSGCTSRLTGGILLISGCVGGAIFLFKPLISNDDRMDVFGSLSKRNLNENSNNCVFVTLLSERSLRLWSVTVTV